MRADDLSQVRSPSLTKEGVRGRTAKSEAFVSVEGDCTRITVVVSTWYKKLQAKNRKPLSETSDLAEPPQATRGHEAKSAAMADVTRDCMGRVQRRGAGERQWRPCSK